MNPTEKPTPSMTNEERYNVVVNHAFGGWHHVGNKKTVQGAVVFSVWGQLSTYDFNQLTRLVLVCHAVFVRAEVTQSGPGMLKIWLSAREPSFPGCSFADYHPSLDDLISDAQKLKERLQ